MTERLSLHFDCCSHGMDLKKKKKKAWIKYKEIVCPVEKLSDFIIYLFGNEHTNPYFILISQESLIYF